MFIFVSISLLRAKESKTRRISSASISFIFGIYADLFFFCDSLSMIPMPTLYEV